ncbi:type IIL restriction-modification enzyme MmeI [Serratia ureilytica]
MEKSKTYGSAFGLVQSKVKPERDKLKGNATAEGRRKNWWKYGRDAKALFHALGRGYTFEKHPKEWDKNKNPLERVIVFATGATKFPCFTLVPNTYIYSHSLCVIASDSFSLFACLSSDIHGIWAFEQGSRLHERLRYTHGDIFETFPLPINIFDKNEKSLSTLGENFFELRSKYMVNENLGMTKFYNAFHSPDIYSPSLSELRKLQVKINLAVLHAYGFDDLDLSHGFHEVAYLPEGKNIRYTISEFAREELLYRLANLNRIRHEEEQREGSIYKRK